MPSETRCIVMLRWQALSQLDKQVDVAVAAIYIYMYIPTLCIYVYIYLHVCIYMYTSIYLHIFIYMHIHVSTSKYLNLYSICMRKYISVTWPVVVTYWTTPMRFLACFRIPFTKPAFFGNASATTRYLPTIIYGQPVKGLKVNNHLPQHHHSCTMLKGMTKLFRLIDKACDQLLHSSVSAIN